MKKAKTNNQETNIKIEYAERENYFISTYHHLRDKRLTMAEKGVLSSFYSLPKNWKITQRATAEYFNISEKSFNTYIKKLVEYGYIEIKKTKKNKALYIIKEKPIKTDFNPKYIKSYTLPQLYAFLNDARTEERYKNLIKKALEQATKTNEHFNKTLDEIEQDKAEQEKPIADTLPF